MREDSAIPRKPSCKLLETRPSLPTLHYGRRFGNKKYKFELQRLISAIQDDTVTSRFAILPILEL